MAGHITQRLAERSRPAAPSQERQRRRAEMSRKSSRSSNSVPPGLHRAPPFCAPTLRWRREGTRVRWLAGVPARDSLRRAPWLIAARLVDPDRHARRLGRRRDCELEAWESPSNLGQMDGGSDRAVTEAKVPDHTGTPAPLMAQAVGVDG
jgi:hypothetical protein